MRKGRFLTGFAGAVLGLICSMFVATAPANARSGLYVGMTPDPTEYSRMFSMYGNSPDVVRVFSSSGPPPWSDSRIQSLKSRGIVPFISFKTFNTSTLNTWLRAMPADIPLIYLTHHHEPEAELDATTFKSRQRANWNVVTALPASIRSRVKYGSLQTSQWTENTAGRTYDTYDAGIGDYWGVDAYHNSWNADYQSPTSFMAKIKAYNTCKPTCRPKVIAELGAISLANDPTDSKRAAWINGVAAIIEADTKFKMVIYWDDLGTTGGAVGCTGSVRQFRLDKRHCNGVTTTVQPSVAAWRNFMSRNTR